MWIFCPHHLVWLWPFLKSTCYVAVSVSLGHLSTVLLVIWALTTGFGQPVLSLGVDIEIEYTDWWVQTIRYKNNGYQIRHHRQFIFANIVDMDLGTQPQDHFRPSGWEGALIDWNWCRCWVGLRLFDCIELVRWVLWCRAGDWADYPSDACVAPSENANECG